MQIENHKEEVPFSHYAAQFAAADPAEIAARLPHTAYDGQSFYVNLLGTKYTVTQSLPLSGEVAQSAGGVVPAVPLLPDCHCEPVPDVTGVEISSSSSSLRGAQRRSNPSPISRHCEEHSDVAISSPNGPVPLPVQTFLLRYLLESKCAPWQGTWKTFREMPWGELYIKPYTGRVLTRAAFTFGTRVEAFRKACESLGATPVAHGDAGFRFDFTDGTAMQIMVWAGDEEFPPNAQVLYSDNFETCFAPEDRVVAGDILITHIKAHI